MATWVVVVSFVIWTLSKERNNSKLFWEQICMCACVYMCVCVYMCEREKEKEGE